MSKLELIEEVLYFDRLGKITSSMDFDEINNELKVTYSQGILDKYGQIFSVKSPPKKSQIRKKGNCYCNSINRMVEMGYNYVEGIITDVESGLKISHAWNVNQAGEHIDFTIKEPLRYKYVGIIIPESLLYEIGARNDHIWYCTLPYLQ